MKIFWFLGATKEEILKLSNETKKIAKISKRDFSYALAKVKNYQIIFFFS